MQGVNEAKDLEKKHYSWLNIGLAVGVFILLWGILHWIGKKITGNFISQNG
jgi:hypothetical protein